MNRAITVGQFSDPFPPVMEGVSVTVRQYASRMARLGRSTVVVTPRAPERKAQSFSVIEYTSLPSPTGGDYRRGLPVLDPHLKKRLNSVRFDIVHAHCPFS